MLNNLNASSRCAVGVKHCSRLESSGYIKLCPRCPSPFGDSIVVNTVAGIWSLVNNSNHLTSAQGLRAMGIRRGRRAFATSSLRYTQWATRYEDSAVGIFSRQWKEEAAKLAKTDHQFSQIRKPRVYRPKFPQ